MNFPNQAQDYQQDEDRIYLAVSYAAKDEAKSMGARWDSDQKRWYGTSDNEELLARFRMVHLKVPFDKKDEAKKLGAMWDPKKKSWYCAGANLALIQRFSGGSSGTTTREFPQSFAKNVPGSRAIKTPKARVRDAPRGNGWGTVPLDDEDFF